MSAQRKPRLACARLKMRRQSWRVPYRVGGRAARASSTSRPCEFWVSRVTAQTSFPGGRSRPSCLKSRRAYRNRLTGRRRVEYVRRTHRLAERIERRRPKGSRSTHSTNDQKPARRGNYLRARGADPARARVRASAVDIREPPGLPASTSGRQSRATATRQQRARQARRTPSRTRRAAQTSRTPSGHRRATRG